MILTRAPNSALSNSERRGNAFTLSSLPLLPLARLWGHPSCSTPLFSPRLLPKNHSSDDPTDSRPPRLAPHWPRLKKVALVRWHNKPNNDPAVEDLGSDLDQLFANCREIEEVDLNEFLVERQQ